jgi:hypothetical protein
VSVKRRLENHLAETAVTLLQRSDRSALQRRRFGDVRTDVAQQLASAVDLWEPLRTSCDLETVGSLDNKPM